MSASFAVASSQYLLNSAAPVTTYPFTVSGWVYMNTLNTRCIWCAGDVTGTSNTFEIRCDSTSFVMVSRAAGSASFLTITSAFAIGSWHFFVARFISATNRRLSVLQGTGAIQHGQNTTNSTPPGITAHAIGARAVSAPDLFWDGSIAELALWDVDIQADGGQLFTATLRQLAYRGPLSLEEHRPRLVEYLPMFDRLAGEYGPEDFSGKFGRQKWTNTNGVNRAGQHPNLGPDYVSLKAGAPALVI